MSDQQCNGRLEVIHGSMFAGKTECMIARLRRHEGQGRTVRAFKHAIDARYDPDHLVTHRGDHFQAQRVPHAAAILEVCADADVVAIDEGHFFKQELVAVVEKLRARGATVLVAGITYDAWGRAFEPLPELIALADEEILCRAPCRICGQAAPFTQRLVPVNTEHMVGGVGEYEPRCAEHFTPLAGPPEQR